MWFENLRSTTTARFIISPDYLAADFDDTCSVHKCVLLFPTELLFTANTVFSLVYRMVFLCKHFVF
jgi:hypothetical protein